MNGSTLTLSLVGALALGAAMGKRGSRARDEQQARVIEALHAWKGDPSSIQLHLMDEAIRAPNPSSRSGRKQREWARALLAELAVHARPSRTPLYRGDHEAPHGIQSWTTRRAVAARWAKKRQGGRVHVLPAGTRGLRIHDYVGDSVYERGGSEGTNEAEWIMQTPETALGQERIARLAATMRQHGSRAKTTDPDVALLRTHGARRFRFSDLPAPARAAIQHYAGEVDWGEQDATAWWYGELPTGVVEDEVFARLDAKSKARNGWTNFSDYHRWYIALGTTPQHAAQGRWPVLLAGGGRGSSEEFIWDGWHRFHSYVRSGHATIPFVLQARAHP